MNSYSLLTVSSMLSRLRMKLTWIPLVRAAQSPAARVALTPSKLLRLNQLEIAAGLRSSNLQFARSHFSARHAEVQPSRWGFRPSAALALGAALGGIGYICGGGEPDGATAALSAAMLLNLAILAHEGGHLVAARALGVSVREFSVGVGPRVAWWQGATTTYSLRALPLFGYISFLTATHLNTAAAAAAAAAAAPAPAAAALNRGLLPFLRLRETAAAAPSPPVLLLEWLPPGRRALVMAAGVAVNALLAAAFVAGQVLSYGEMGLVVHPGARVIAVGGWEGRDEEPPPPPDQRLHAGDVVLGVGRWRLPADGQVEKLFVQALQAAASEPAPAAAAATAADAITADAGGDECAHLGTQGARSLDGVKLAVLRGSGGGGGATAATASPPQTIMYLDAAHVLQYETLAVGPNVVTGYRRPADAWEAAMMTGRELVSWMNIVLSCWAEALSAATGASSSGGSSSVRASSGSSISSASSGSNSIRASSGSNSVRASSGSSISSASSGSSNGPQMVGPLGLVASAAEVAVAAAREARTPSCYSYCSAAATCGSSEDPEDSDTGPNGPQDLYDDTVHQPPVLLGLGIQLNLQLAAVNLLPLPVLDGGQLLLVALEAARGGRRLPPFLERSALLGSGLLVGCWVAMLSLQDLIGLVDRAAGRLAASVGPSDPLHYHQLQPATTASAATAATAAAGELRVLVQVAAGGGNAKLGPPRPAGRSKGECDADLDGTAAAAAGAWAT